MNWTDNIASYRFKTYCQTGETGFITNIMNNIGGWSDEKIIVDLGAWDGEYLSNTKYFERIEALRVLIDGDNRGNDEVHEHWITKENVCELLNKYNVPREFDVLNIDLDGNDADVLEAVLKEFKPKLIVSEFNGALDGCKKMKYNPEHQWNKDDYYGYSLEYGKKIAHDNGYRIVFQNDSLNLYYVRKDLLKDDLVIDLKFQKKIYHPHNEIGEWIEYNMQGEGEAFNGDFCMKAAFMTLRDRYNISSVIETGTYKGDTTEWLANNFEFVSSIEVHRDYYIQASKRLISTNAKVYFGDSSELLLPLLKAAPGNPLVFLDAHWYANPMQGEFKAIKESGRKPILVIHDFENPEHPEFKHDTYPDQEYNLSAIKPYLDEIYGQYDYYYNQDATGIKVGCIFIIPK